MNYHLRFFIIYYSIVTKTATQNLYMAYMTCYKCERLISLFPKFIITLTLNTKFFSSHSLILHSLFFILHSSFFPSKKNHKFSVTTCQLLVDYLSTVWQLFGNSFATFSEKGNNLATRMQLFFH